MPRLDRRAFLTACALTGLAWGAPGRRASGAGRLILRREAREPLPPPTSASFGLCSGDERTVADADSLIDPLWGHE
jgi:hypothetical protein